MGEKGLKGERVCGLGGEMPLRGGQIDDKGEVRRRMVHEAFAGGVGSLFGGRQGLVECVECWLDTCRARPRLAFVVLLSSTSAPFLDPASRTELGTTIGPSANFETNVGSCVLI